MQGRHIADWDGPGTGFTVAESVAYVDTITLYCWCPLPAGMLSSLRKAYGPRLIVKALRNRSDGPSREAWLITIHQPEESTLVLLNTVTRTFTVHEVHIAFDFLCPDERQAMLATTYLNRRVVQKWRRRGHETHQAWGTRYWRRATGKRKIRRNIAAYGDRRSKAEPQHHCAHFEFRFSSAAACKRAGLGTPDALRSIDPVALLRRQTRIAPIDEKRLERAIVKKARTRLHTSRRPAATLNGIAQHLRRVLPRCLQDEDHTLNEATIARARSQSLWDHRPELRSALCSVEWSSFTPAPRWHRW